MKEPIPDTDWSFPFPDTTPLYVERNDGNVSALIDGDGDMLIEHEVSYGWSGGTGQERVYVPARVLEALLRRAGRIT